MKTLLIHGRKDQIVINIRINDFAVKYFEIFKKRLTKSYIFHYKIDSNKLNFKGSLFRFVWNGWDLFNPISSGEIEFTSEGGEPFIRHQIKFTEIFVIALIFNIIPLFTLKYSPNWSLYVFLAIWFLYAVSYIVTIYRFNSYISEVLIEVNKTGGYEFIKKDEEVKG